VVEKVVTREVEKTIIETVEVEKVVTATPEPESAEPKILKVRLTGDIGNLDPAHRISMNDSVVINAVFNGLVRYAANSYDLDYQLAETLEQSEDGLEIYFKLREGVMWHKGYGELTAEDVKFSYERFQDPELAAAYADDWATLDHVEVIDKYSGKIILNEPFAPLWKSTLPVASGNIISKKQVEEIGHEAFATNIVGTGPYIFEEWKPKEMVILKRNPDYWGKAPYWDEIHLIPIEDDKTAEVALEAGEVHFAGISIPAVDRFEADPGFLVWRRPSLAWRWIAMNLDNPKLEDINVRKAIIYGLDVPSMLQAAFMGQAEQEFTLVPPGLVGHWADAPRYERDVAKAQEFMAAAGVDSLELTLAFMDTAETKTIAEIAQQNLAEIGIDLILEPLDSSTFWALTFDEQSLENDLILTRYTMQPDPSWATAWFTCDQIGVWNAQRWCNERYDELHKLGLVTMDDAERDKMYIEMQELWDEAAQTVWITHGAFIYAYTPDIAPATTPHGRPQFEMFGPAQ
jgi:peptide/nickel transport system substrate-binding protein